MKTLTALLATLFITHANAGELYYAVGLGMHNEKSDCPEACFRDNTVGRLRVGYLNDNGIAIDLSHTSAPRYNERGRGFNALFIEYRKVIGD